MLIPIIPLFAEKLSHPFVPLADRTDGARSAGQGRPSAGACALPLTAASTLAGWWRNGDGSTWRCAVLLVAGALFICTGSGGAVAQSAPIVRPVAADPYAAHIAKASQRFGIPEHWIRVVLRAESNGDVSAVSRTGAMGLMQVMPDTWAGLRVRYRLGRDPHDPRDNIMAGAAYLREMWDRYGNVAAMLAAYNAGPGRYDEYLSTGRTLPAETRAYVAALAPVIGGAAATMLPVAAPPRPPDWRDAPLFVMRSDDTRTAASSPSEGKSGNTPAPVPVGDSADSKPHDDSIFVARASAGEIP